MVKKYLLISSYPSALAPFVFLLDTPNIHVLAPPLLCSFFRDMKIPCTEIPCFRLTAESFYDFILLKKMGEDLIQQANTGDELHFFISTYDVAGFYFVKEWAQRIGPCFYHSCEDLIADYPKLRTWGTDFSLQKCKHCVNMLLYKWVLGLDLASVITESRWVVAADAIFFEEHKVQTILDSANWQSRKMNAIKQYSCFQDKCDVLIIADDLLDGEYVDADALAEIYFALLGLSLKVMVKTHPTEKESEADQDCLFFTSCGATFYANYIPAEFLLANAKFVVAVVSSTLNSALLFDRVVPISLIDLVKWRSRELKDEFKKKLMRRSAVESKGEILLPSSQKELFRMIDSGY